jgi:hypothetical protein
MPSQRTNSKVNNHWTHLSLPSVVITSTISRGVTDYQELELTSLQMRWSSDDKDRYFWSQNRSLTKMFNKAAFGEDEKRGCWLRPGLHERSRGEIKLQKTYHASSSEAVLATGTPRGHESGYIKDFMSYALRKQAFLPTIRKLVFRVNEVNNHWTHLSLPSIIITVHINTFYVP